jgi:hypothetical protein
MLISQTLDDLLFDVEHRRVIVSENTPRGRKEFEGKLAKTLEIELTRASSAEAAKLVV